MNNKDTDGNKASVSRSRAITRSTAVNGNAERKAEIEARYWAIQSEISALIEETENLFKELASLDD